VDKSNSENVEMFLNDNIPKNKRKCITTDHNPAYNLPL
jgi:hypothetical protein